MTPVPHFTPAAECLARIVTVGFTATGLIVGWLAGIGNVRDALPLLLFYGLLLLNTYFSVRCFSSVPESESAAQTVVNVVLALQYAVLAALFQNPPAFLWLTVILFFVAALKYALIESPQFSRLLRRKIMLDITGGIGCAAAFAVLSYVPASWVLWTWFGGFVLVNAYVLLGSTLYVPLKD